MSDKGTPEEEKARASWAPLQIVRGSTLTGPPWPGTIVTICISCFMTGGPGKEHRTNKPPPIGRVQERSKGDTNMSDHLPESFSLASILAEQGVHHQEGL